MLGILEQSVSDVQEKINLAEKCLMGVNYDAVYDEHQMPNS